MSINYQHFEYKGARLGYHQAGIGRHCMLIFHGFGQDHSVFDLLAHEIGDHFTLISFDLFFHGQSKWPHGSDPLTKDYWKEILHQFLTENKIERFSLMGFSLGGKFALASFEAFPDRVDGIYLLAPDGIRTNFWYSLATYPLVLRSWFKSMIHKPNRFFSIIHLVQKLKLVDKGVIRFAQSQMDTLEKRERVYYSWVVFRLLKFDINKIAGLMETHRIAPWVFIGKFDKIITAENMHILLSRLSDYKLYIMDTGHNGLIAQSMKEMKNIRTQKGLNS